MQSTDKKHPVSNLVVDKHVVESDELSDVSESSTMSDHSTSSQGSQASGRRSNHRRKRSRTKRVIKRRGKGEEEEEGGEDVTVRYQSRSPSSGDESGSSVPRRRRKTSEVSQQSRSHKTRASHSKRRKSNDPRHIPQYQPYTPTNQGHLGHGDPFITQTHGRPVHQSQILSTSQSIPHHATPERHTPNHHHHHHDAFNSRYDNFDPQSAPGFQTLNNSSNRVYSRHPSHLSHPPPPPPTPLSQPIGKHVVVKHNATVRKPASLKYKKTHVKIPTAKETPSQFNAVMSGTFQTTDLKGKQQISREASHLAPLLRVDYLDVFNGRRLPMDVVSQWHTDLIRDKHRFLAFLMLISPNVHGLMHIFE